MAAATATFDTLKFANTLKAAGVPDKQAEAQAVAFAEVMQLNLKDLATTDELAVATKEVKQELKEVETRLAGRIDTLAAQIRGELTLLKWMFGAILTIFIGILVRVLVYRGPL